MPRVSKRIRRQSLRGWLKWMPVVGLVFGALYFDCWLSTERRLQDFELSRLRDATAGVVEELEGYQAQTAGLATFERLDALAEELGLQVPEPGQIECIYYDPARETLVPFAYPFSVARLDATVAPAPSGDPEAGTRPLSVAMPELLPAWE